MTLVQLGPGDDQEILKTFNTIVRRVFFVLIAIFDQPRQTFILFEIKLRVTFGAQHFLVAIRGVFVVIELAVIDISFCAFSIKLNRIFIVALRASRFLDSLAFIIIRFQQTQGPQFIQDIILITSYAFKGKGILLN